jgi:hypothetical protein
MIIDGKEVVFYLSRGSREWMNISWPDDDDGYKRYGFNPEEKRWSYQESPLDGEALDNCKVPLSDSIGEHDLICQSTKNPMAAGSPRGIKAIVFRKPEQADKKRARSDPGLFSSGKYVFEIHVRKRQ